MTSSKRKPSDDAPPPPVPAGILDGNGRTARLARWLRDLPKRPQVDTLVLELKSEEGWARVQSWDRRDTGMHLSLPIDAHVTDLANELGAYVSCRLSWIESATGNTWTEHALRAQPEGMASGQAFSGDAQSAAVQTQRALERLVGAFMGGIETSTRLSERAAEIAASNYEGAQADLALLRERVVSLEREKSEVELQLEEALSAAERISAESQQQGQQQQVTGLITQLIASQQSAPKAS
jgi:hypothetical protein